MRRLARMLSADRTGSADQANCLRDPVCTDRVRLWTGMKLCSTQLNITEQTQTSEDRRQTSAGCSIGASGDPTHTQVPKRVLFEISRIRGGWPIRMCSDRTFRD